MSYKKLLHVTVLSTVSIGSFYLGSQNERKNLFKNKFKDLPGLPVFGTVSAATPMPYVEKAEIVTSNASRVSQIMKYGFPGLDNVRSFDDYVLSYDRRNRVAHWVFEHLRKDSVKYNEEVDRAKCDFTPDESIHSFFRYIYKNTIELY